MTVAAALKEIEGFSRDEQLQVVHALWDFAVIYRRVRAALVETFPYVVYFRSNVRAYSCSRYCMATAIQRSGEGATNQ